MARKKPIDLSITYGVICHEQGFNNLPARIRFCNLGTQEYEERHITNDLSLARDVAYRLKATWPKCQYEIVQITYLEQV